MIRCIIIDVKRTLLLEGANKSFFAQKLFVLCFAYGLHALIIFRLGKALESKFSRWWFAPLYYPCFFTISCLRFLTENIYGIHIDPMAEVGEGFYIGHFGNIKVKNCIIGKNCSIHQMVTIGLKSNTSRYDDKVLIGDNVWIGGHTDIYSGVKIGEGATIVVGSGVFSDIRPYAMVMGNPARVIKINFNNASLMGL